MGKFQGTGEDRVWVSEVPGSLPEPAPAREDYWAPEAPEDACEGCS